MANQTRTAFAFTLFGVLYSFNIVLAQVTPDISRFVLSPLAVGGMLQGLFTMQIRPEGGFYEEKYKEIFKDDMETQSVGYESLLHLSPEDLIDRDIKPVETLANDGKLLKEFAMGKSPNPCFEIERIAKNRLLGLMCSLKMQNEFDLK